MHPTDSLCLHPRAYSAIKSSLEGFDADIRRPFTKPTHSTIPARSHVAPLHRSGRVSQRAYLQQSRLNRSGYPTRLLENATSHADPESHGCRIPPDAALRRRRRDGRPPSLATNA
jgi:hypothetical protein